MRTHVAKRTSLPKLYPLIVCVVHRIIICIKNSTVTIVNVTDLKILQLLQIDTLKPAIEL